MKSLVLLVEGPFGTGHCRLNCYSLDVVTQTRLHINYVPRYYRNCKPFRIKSSINNPLPYKSKPQPNQDSDANFLNKTARHGKRLSFSPIPFVTSNTRARLWWRWWWWWWWLSRGGGGGEGGGGGRPV